MASAIELEILNVNEDTGEPNAYSYHPSALSYEALTTIIGNQINVKWPWEVHYYLQEEYPKAGTYKTIEAIEFVRAKSLDTDTRHAFVKRIVTSLKALNTSDIIFAEPLVPRERGR